nr:MAG TPA: hypothetical protein [Caudoviricetes sp.]
MWVAHCDGTRGVRSLFADVNKTAEVPQPHGRAPALL